SFNDLRNKEKREKYLILEHIIFKKLIERLGESPKSDEESPDFNSNIILKPEGTKHISLSESTKNTRKGFKNL
ncbi:2294_t:CDS:2, partial [Entrophospora sp. SA101]